MTISMYQASVPIFVRMLRNLRSLIEAGAAHAETRKFDATLLAESRLFVDMFPLVRQVQIATDAAKGCAARLAGIEPPTFEDTEKTLPQVVARINRTIAFLETLTAAQIDGSEAKSIVLELRSGPLKFDGQTYLLHFALPNFYFHVTTSYNILRHNGVEVGKMDFLGRD